MVAGPAQSLAIVAAGPRRCQRGRRVRGLLGRPASPWTRSAALPDRSSGAPKESREIVDTVENAGFTTAKPVDNPLWPIVGSGGL
jgi:hypothetical protein